MVMQTCLMRISIHTSAREVTAVWVYQVRNGCEFQSTLPQGKWQKGKEIRKGKDIFQSTLPQGKWRLCMTFIISEHNFNPHFRKGSDSRKGQDPSERYDFNPHFRKGSDFVSADRPLNRYRFQSTLPQGKWPFPGISRYPIFTISIHTSAREVTAYFCYFYAFLTNISIHTSAREVTDFWFSVSDC